MVVELNQFLLLIRTCKSTLIIYLLMILMLSLNHLLKKLNMIQRWMILVMLLIRWSMLIPQYLHLNLLLNFHLNLYLNLHLRLSLRFNLKRNLNLSLKFNLRRRDLRNYWLPLMILQLLKLPMVPFKLLLGLLRNHPVVVLLILHLLLMLSLKNTFL